MQVGEFINKRITETSNSFLVYDDNYGWIDVTAYLDTLNNFIQKLRESINAAHQND